MGKDDSKTFSQEKDNRGQKLSENFKNDNITNGNKDLNRDSKGGKRDYDKNKSNDYHDKNKSNDHFDKKKSNNLTASKKDNDRKKDVNSDRKDNPSDRRKEDNKKKDSQTNKKKEGKSDTRDNRDSQPKEFNPVFHGIKGEKSSEKLDKFEKSLFGEESKNKSFRSDNSRSKSGYQRENSRSDFNSKQQNGHHENRRNHNDQDYGQWNGNYKRQQSNHSKEELLTNGMQSMNLGGQAKGGYQGQSQQPRGQNNDVRVNRNNSDRRQGGYGDGRGHRGRGSHQGGHQGGHVGQRINWQEGQRCLAKYWEDEQYYEATITGLSPTTAVVLFEAYGNYEEVLLGDLKGSPSGQSYGSNIAPTPGLPPAFRH